MRRYLFLILVIFFSLLSICFSGEFDFGDGAVEFKDERGLPLRGKAAFESGRQTGQNPRWIEVGPTLNSTLDWHGTYGTLHGELTLAHNRAFRIENDPPSTVEQYENESLIRELYFKKSFSDYTLTFGRSITVWGTNDFLSVLDVVSPSDQTEFLFSTPEEARLGQLMAKMEVWFGKNQLTMLLSPRPFMNRNPGEGHPYSLFPSARRDETPSVEAGIRWKLERERGSSVFILGEFHDRDPLFVTESTGTFKRFGIYRVAGLGMVQAQAPVLLRFEAAWFSKKPYQVVSESGAMKVENVNTSAFSLGADYIHEEYGSVTAEANAYFPAKTTSRIKRIYLFSLNWLKTFYRDSLSVNLTATGFQSLSNLLLRLGLSFQVTDTVEITTQYTYINVSADNEEYRAFEGFDRFDIALSYSFDLEKN